MIKSLATRFSSTILLLVWAFALFLPLSVSAADDVLTVSVTPPLFQLTIGPGEFWASALKIVNTNPFDVTYYAHLVNFENTGEGGTGNFIPILNNEEALIEESFSLAHWVDITKDPIVVPKGQSIDVPFTVDIPENAEPGGHYAAILVGTQPPELGDGVGPTLSVSSYVSSLIFVRITGDVVEKARIREFVTNKGLYERPEAEFVLRFENTGTVHVQPQGTITIYNMWGKERGSVAINQKTHFGNVLPGSIRKFEFDWSSDFSPLDIGRYSAVVTLAYGDEVKQNVSATTYFWVIPVVPALGTLAVFFGLIAGITFFIRRYIKHVLTLEHSLHAQMYSDADVQHEEVHVTMESLALPIKEGIIDLRNMTSQRPEPAAVMDEEIPSVEDALPEAEKYESRLSRSQFFMKYRLFFVFMLLIGVSATVAVFYFGEVLVPSRTYHISNVSVQEETEEVKDIKD